MDKMKGSHKLIVKKGVDLAAGACWGGRACNGGCSPVGTGRVEWSSGFVAWASVR